jgi:hypothetical protein
VSDVLPWSMWPIVPTFTCGFVRSNFFLATGSFSFQCWGGVGRRGWTVIGEGWSPERDSNP